jgi:membrane protein implicated in regulation of membrane protease activity
MTLDLAIPWWLWVGGGLGLMAFETMVPTSFYAFFFGVGSVLTGGVVALGLAPTLQAQGIALVILSTLAVIARKPVISRFKLHPESHAIDSLVGETALALEPIAVGAIGKVELRGASWSARNTGSEPIALAGRCRVEKVDGLTLHVRI